MKRLKQQSGAALITVLVALMIISIMILEFQFSSIVESKLAYNDLNQLQAYYLAKSGAHIGMLRVALFVRAKQDPTLKKQFGNMNIGPMLDRIWDLPLPAFPPDPTKMGKLLKSDKDAAAKAIEQTKVSEGQFSVSISSEASKINLNYLVVPPQFQNQQVNFRPPPQSLYHAVGGMLVALLDNFLKASDDPYAEYGDMRPEETVLAISDWVTPGDFSLLGGSKDAFYEALTPPYRAKRNRFYTLDELKLVRTIDEHLYSKIRPHVTVYSYDGRININSMSDTLMRALYPDFTEDDVKKINEEKARIGGAWSTEADFVRYVTSQLGRSGFTTMYPNAAEYPFSVNSQSFMIDSLGFLQRSKSKIQRSIKVGVAMSFGKKDVSGLNPADCAKDATLWLDSRFTPECKYKPTNTGECTFVGGSWDQGSLCCRINNIAPVCLPAGAGGSVAGAGTAPGAAPGTGTTPPVQTPNGVKILYWTES